MARLFGAGLGLLAMLTVIWLGWEFGSPAVSGSTLPPAFQAPEETQPPIEPTDGYDPVAGAMLIAKELLPYDGPALWDAGEIGGVAALELWNAGDKLIRYAEVVVRQGERELTFAVTFLPPGGRVIVPEKEQQPYTRAAVTDIFYPIVLPMDKETGSERVTVTESGAFSLVVTNVTEEALSCVRVFYKQYDARRGVYVGAATYSAVLTGLKPGERRTVMPYRYAAGYTKVVAVVAEREQS